MHYRYRETVYHITVLQTRAATDKNSVTVDGVMRGGKTIPLIDDHQEHFVELRFDRVRNERNP